MELSAFESELRLNDILFRLEASHQICIKELDKVLQVAPDWSDFALNLYDSALLKQCASEVVEWYKKAAIGIPIANEYPLPTPLNSETAKKYIAEIWEIETTDIDIMIAMTE